MIPRLLAAAGLLVLAITPAHAADDVPLPPLTPKGQFFVMTMDDATSSGKCIGRPITPMCAVETMLACYVRGKDDLCRIGQGLEKDSGIVTGPLSPMIYWVVRREVLTDRRFPWRPGPREGRRGELSMKPGDVRIDIYMKDCPGQIIPAACTIDVTGYVSPRIAYIVRRYGDHWSVVDWRPPYGDYPTLHRLLPQQ